MEIVRDEQQLKRYISEAVDASGDSPVLLDRFLADAVEVDVDALSDGTDVHIAGVMQHIEEAGVHSGDSACSLPPHSLDPSIVQELMRQSVELARALKVVGLMNVQFAVRDNQIYILEVNPRASRTVPFVAKAIGSPIAAIAARLMAGEKLAAMELKSPDLPHYAVKEVVLPFNRFPGVDTLLGPEMRSTGEVMGIDDSFARAFLKAQIAAGSILPKQGRVFVSFRDADKTETLVDTARTLVELGFSPVATRGTAEFLEESGIRCEVVRKFHEGKPNIVDQLLDHQIDVIMNTSDGRQSVHDSQSLRAVALSEGIPYFTTARAAHAASRAIQANQDGDLGVKPLQAY